MYSSLVALAFGIMGIVFDRRRLLPIVVTVVAGGFVLLFLHQFLPIVRYAFF